VVDEVVQVFEATVETPAAVRRFLRDTLQTWKLDGFGEVTELLCSELVTNVVLHVGEPMTVRAVREQPDVFRIEVTDLSPVPPELRRAGPDDECGRGLAIVDALADDWGTRIGEDGKTVWFTIDAAHATEEIHDE
jgi:anti-sigma regulatory factor (Ser/Thr protein kinase)